jgi:hypothetical protein
VWYKIVNEYLIKFDFFSMNSLIIKSIWKYFFKIIWCDFLKMSIWIWARRCNFRKTSFICICTLDTDFEGSLECNVSINYKNLFSWHSKLSIVTRFYFFSHIFFVEIFRRYPKQLTIANIMNHIMVTYRRILVYSM